MRVKYEISDNYEDYCKDEFWHPGQLPVQIPKMLEQWVSSNALAACLHLMNEMSVCLEICEEGRIVFKVIGEDFTDYKGMSDTMHQKFSLKELLQDAIDYYEAGPEDILDALEKAAEDVRALIDPAKGAI